MALLGWRFPHRPFGDKPLSWLSPRKLWSLHMQQVVELRPRPTATFAERVWPVIDVFTRVLVAQQRRRDLLPDSEDYLGGAVA